MGQTQNPPKRGYYLVTKTSFVGKSDKLKEPNISEGMALVYIQRNAMIAKWQHGRNALHLIWEIVITKNGGQNGNL